MGMIHPSNYMSKDETDKIYHKKCHDCGKFLRRESWVAKSHPWKKYGLCEECLSNYADSFNRG